MATMNVKDAAGSTVAVEKPLTPGQAAMAASRPVVIASDQSAVPVSLASVPSHAVTNAGTFVTQENGAGLTALQLIDDNMVAPGTAIGSTKNALVGGAVTTAAPTYTNGQVSPLNLDTAGNLRVNVAAGGGSGGTSSTVGSAAPSTATAVGFTDGTNLQLGVIKAASTAPVATDRAIVVAVSPNSQNANGTTTDANSTPVAWSTEGKAQLGSLTETAPASDTASSGLNGRLQRIAQRISSMIALLPTALGSAGGLKVDDIYGQYETVAASQTAQALGATGATGDYLAYVEVFPGTAGCGVVTILDNAGTWGTFAGGGTTALPSLVPFRIDVGAYSTSGAWKITTGANVTAVGVGKFT